MSVQTLLQSARIPFLILAPACVFLGLAVALHDGAEVSALPVVLCFLGALLAHVSVNAFNEYFDFRSGLDMQTIRTPFSGGSGALPAAPQMAKPVLFMAVATLALTLMIGLYFVWLQGWAMVPPGLIGALLIVAYTEKITRSPVLCLIAPGLGFGILMVLGVCLALTGTLTPTAVFASLVPFFLVNNLLLLNQFPDIDADREVGRYHLPIAYGTGAASSVFGGFNLLAALTIVVAVVSNVFPVLALVAILPILPTLLSWHGARRLGARIATQPQWMAINVVANILTPVVLGGVLLAA